MHFYSRVHWPKTGILCFPVFTPTNCEKDENFSNSNRDTVTMTTSSSSRPLSPSAKLSQERNGDGGDCHGDTSASAVVINGIGQVESTNQNAGNEEIELESGNDIDTSYTSDIFVDLVHSESCVPGTLPSDRDSLLQLRSQTAMELVWLKQAITSRQKVSL